MREKRGQKKEDDILIPRENTLKEVFKMTAMMLRTPRISRRLFDWGFTDWFDEFFREDRLSPRLIWDERRVLPRSYEERCFCPSVDTYVKDNVVHLRAELPGVELQDVDVSLEGTCLTISGQRKRGHHEEGASYESREMAYGDFCRTFSVPEGIAADKIHASYENGILEVTVPLPEPLIEKHIPIEGKRVAIEEKGGEPSTA